jgi:hypothetical protein
MSSNVAQKCEYIAEPFFTHWKSARVLMTKNSRKEQGTCEENTRALEGTYNKYQEQKREEKPQIVQII